VIKRRAR